MALLSADNTNNSKYLAATEFTHEASHLKVLCCFDLLA